MSSREEKSTPPNVYELLDRFATQQEQQGKQLELLARAVSALSDKMGAQPQQQGGGGDFLKLLVGLLGGEQKQAVNIKHFTETAAYFAKLADVLGHYRHPALPYGHGDKFLMREGARRHYEMRYYGVKSAEQPPEKKEMPTDEELDKMLGFETEAEEEKKEKKDGHAI